MTSLLQISSAIIKISSIREHSLEVINKKLACDSISLLRTLFREACLYHTRNISVISNARDQIFQLLVVITIY